MAYDGTKVTFKNQASTFTRKSLSKIGLVEELVCNL